MTFTNQSIIIHVIDIEKAMQWYKCRKYFKNKQESWNTCKKLIKFYFRRLYIDNGFMW